MPNEDNAPFFGVNDFDESIFAPFSYDVKRSAARRVKKGWKLFKQDHDPGAFNFVDVS